MFAQFREACENAGHTADPGQMGWGVPIYVAETDRQAREEFEPHCSYFQKNLLKGVRITPPGYTSAKSALAIIKNRPLFLSEQKNWDDIEKGVFSIVGSPTSVRQRLQQHLKDLGCGVLLTGCQTGTLPHELARKSMELFAREVMPHLKLINQKEPVGFGTTHV
jgi:alkanesulfonate monooxygenase SsuD/methylene tetrahydromethanopterin reductase-like flavin-dependent oxidoreductase (luciferase family)